MKKLKFTIEEEFKILLKSLINISSINLKIFSKLTDESKSKLNKKKLFFVVMVVAHHMLNI